MNNAHTVEVLQKYDGLQFRANWVISILAGGEY